MTTQPSEAFDLVNNGTARIFIEGEPYAMRRPKVGEYKKLRELLNETSERIQAKAQEKPKKAPAKKRTKVAAEPTDEEPPKIEDDADAKFAEAREARRITNELNDFVEAQYQDWVDEAVKMLGDKPLPPNRDDWPLFTMSFEFITKLIQHWRSVPLALGGK